VRAVRANVERMSAVNPDAGVLISRRTRRRPGRWSKSSTKVHLGGIQNITFSTTQ
jgi:hypothetical protein